MPNQPRAESPRDVSNNFDCSANAHGAKCPFRAHICKSIPHGSSPGGLTFNNSVQIKRYRASIESQFQFLQTQRINNPGFPKPKVGIDSVINQGSGRQFHATDAQSLRAELEAYAAELSQDRSFKVEAGDSEPGFGTCGTPHVEIYGPHGKLLTTDCCDSRVHKRGLVFLRSWLAVERVL